MKRLLLLLGALCLILSVQAEQKLNLGNEDDGITVVKIISQDDAPPQFGPFSFFGQESPLRRLFDRAMGHAPQSSLLHKLFHFPVFESENDQPVMTVQIVEQDDSEPFNFAQTVSGMFQHMHQMMQEMRAPSFMNMEPQEDRIRAGCPLLRVCATDIDSFCAVARLSQTVGSIEHCLKAHRQKLSDACGSALDARAGETESSTPEVPSTDVPAESSEASAPAAPVTPVTPVTPAPVEPAPPSSAPVAESTPVPVRTTKPVHRDRQSNIAKADRFMAKLPASCRPYAKNCDASVTASPIVNTMVCLHSNKQKLPADCLQRIGTTPLFNCAVDVVKFCPQVRGQAKIISCLSQHELSADCVSSLHNHKAADPQFDDLNVKADQLSVKATASAATGSHVAPLALGIGFVALIAVVAAVIAVARRRQQRNSPVVVQLANPVDMRQTL